VKDQHTPQVVIGWTGTHSTIAYLYQLIPVLQELEKAYTFTFLVISDKQPDFTLNSLLYLPWNKASEMSDLLKMNIGVMPLTDDVWAKGKCGFKALQYMALGIPALVSPVGVNTEIVNHGLNGYICYTTDDWKNYLKELLVDVERRTQMGRAARQKVENQYSIQANCRNFLDLFLTA
jgi:glycosyltransferase involved in cell wall biosynthesis